MYMYIELVKTNQLMYKNASMYMYCILFPLLLSLFILSFTWNFLNNFSVSVSVSIPSPLATGHVQWFSAFLSSTFSVLLGSGLMTFLRGGEGHYQLKRLRV